MSPPNSELIRVEDIPNAGRGVIAIRPIVQNTPVLRSKRPAAHVIFHEYRKEVCAQCFLYDRGRALPVRQNAVGKVFCTSECVEEWVTEQGEVGISAWENLHSFLQLKAKAINRHVVPLLDAKPDVEQIALAWEQVEGRSKSHNHVHVAGSNARNKRPLHTRSVDPDILSYLLSGTLYFHRHSSTGYGDILDLAMDETPFRDILDLDAHCKSFVQLRDILPPELFSEATAQLCKNLINATSHNSFGIRSGSEDGEEYMGYALFPDASYFNHSCNPNISKTRIGSAWEFRAQRDIRDGEQCCITYLGGDEKDLTVEARRARLRLHWGFDCMCQRCLQESAL